LYIVGRGIKMVGNFIYLLNQGIIFGLLLFGVYVILQNIRTFLFPQRVGRIVSIGGEIKDCKNCDRIYKKSTIPVGVKVDTGEIYNAEISPCSICIDRIRVGDYVGITKIGSRIIAQRIGKGSVMKSK